MKFYSHLNIEIVWIAFLSLGIPLFFPFALFGDMPGPLHPGLGDTYVFFEPMTRAAAKALQLGQNPFWMHEAGIGAPVILSLGAGILHPFHVLHLVLPDQLAFVFAWWMRLAMTSVFTYLYLRKINVESWISGVSALSLTFGSVSINYSHEIIGFGFCFFPAIIYFTECNRNRIHLLSLVMLAVCVLGMIIGGFLSVSLFLLLLYGAYSFFHFRVTRFIWLQLFVVGAVVLSSPAIYEVFEFYPSSGFDPDKRKALFMYTPELKNIFAWWIPSIWGDIVNFRQLGERDFYGRLLNAGILAPIVLIWGLILVIWSHQKIRAVTFFWLIVLFFCFIVYFNIFRIKEILQYLPLIGQHPTTRLQVVIVLATVLGFACLTQDLLASGVWQNFAWMYRTASLVIGLTLVVGLLSQGMVYPRVWVYAGLTALALACWPAAIRGSRYARAAVLTIVIVSSLLTTHIYTVYAPYSSYYPETALIQQVKSRLKPGGRILDLGDHVFKQTAIAYGVSSVTQLWFAPKEVKQLLEQVTTQSLTALTYESINSIDWKKGTEIWGTLAQLHVQLVLLPRQEFVVLQSKAEHAGYWREFTRDVDTVVIEVLPLLGPDELLQGKGYRKFRESGGLIVFETHGVLDSQIELPVRFHKDWKVLTPNDSQILLHESGRGFIQVTGVVEGSQIRLQYWPTQIRPLMIFAALYWLFLLILYWINSRLRKN